MLIRLTINRVKKNYTIKCTYLKRTVLVFWHIRLWKQQHNQIKEHIHYSQKFLCPFEFLPSYPSTPNPFHPPLIPMLIFFLPLYISLHFLELWMKGIILYLSIFFFAWLLSLNNIILRVIRVLYVSIVLFLLSSLPLYGMSIHLFIDLFSNIHCFQLWVIKDRVVINIFSYVYKYSFGYMSSFLLGKRRRLEWLDHMVADI